MNSRLLWGKPQIDIAVKEFIFLCCDNLCYNPNGEQL